MGKWYIGKPHAVKFRISTRHEGNLVLLEKLIFYLKDDWIIMSAGHVKGSLGFTIPLPQKIHKNNKS